MVACRRHSHRIDRRRAPGRSSRPRCHRARPNRHVSTAPRSRVPHGREHLVCARDRDSSAVHGLGRCSRLQDAAVEHRGRGSAVHGRRWCIRRRHRARQCAAGAHHPGDGRRRARPWRGVGRDPRAPEGLRQHERDHHVVDVELRRRSGARLPHLRQPLVLARPLTGREHVPAGQASRRGRPLAIVVDDVQPGTALPPRRAGHRCCARRSRLAA